jgi:photosystem II stability/assembly factor-like uncharacterized protein
MPDRTRQHARTMPALVVILSLSAAALPAAAQANPTQPKYKGVFEPVNFPADVSFTDVHFVSPDIGWATGWNGSSGGGVIVGTRDGGETWTVQVGDPESSDEVYGDLRFVDATHGFAVQQSSGDHRLLRTSDGESWEVSGAVPEHRGDYVFISPTVGFVSYGPEIRRTEDAGRSWREVGRCRLKVEVEGLMRDAECEIGNFHFPTARVGYGIGRSSQSPGAFLVKTEDGGATWTAWRVLPEESGYESHLFFTDQQRGVACLYGGKFFRTQDGGQSWSQIPGPSCDGKPFVKFAAGGQVGWTAVYNVLNYTTNGGGRWTSREIAFPTQVVAFSLPRHDRGYVVGEHGMIYRYRVVPEAAAVKPRSLAAPVMGPPVEPAGGGGR